MKFYSFQICQFFQFCFFTFFTPKLNIVCDCAIIIDCCSKGAIRHIIVCFWGISNNYHRVMIVNHFAQSLHHSLRTPNTVFFFTLSSNFKRLAFFLI